MFTIKAFLALCAASGVLAGAGGDTSIIAHEGNPVGREVTDGDLTIYVAQPEREYGDIAVLYLTDVFGIQLKENKLKKEKSTTTDTKSHDISLADSFSRAGFLTIAPDLFAGEPAPEDLNQPGWDIEKFLEDNSPEVVDPRIEHAIRYLREELGVRRFAVTGYCFGGRFAFRFGAEGKGPHAVFAAHPSNLGDDEILNVKVASSIAAAENDSMLPPERRAEIEGLLRKAAIPYQVSLYSGTNHGFGVRANISNPQEKFAKEAAFFQAVRWFEQWA
ncbi:hypothetical protein jhhlp_004562 [Lomentospora prolificans]|uniref:Dienelactone hydrolase domain-containing protein n=1 Tax=Lomentospora prolificans TaxID=41688 RepID=A0A2N3NBX7_9PEZI|nr:hypothetical protein jhhlp_004562 [Lomentospora prolificans]